MLVEFNLGDLRILGRIIKILRVEASGDIIWVVKQSGTTWFSEVIHRGVNLLFTVVIIAALSVLLIKVEVNLFNEGVF